MKECPVCKAKCFDDMDVCYGCLHEFKPEEETSFGQWPSAAALADDLLEDNPFEEDVPERNDAPQGMPWGASDNAQGAVFRLEVPAGMKNFTIRCESLQIEGSLA